MNATTCSSADIMARARDYIAACRAGDPERYIKPGDRHDHLCIVRFDGLVPDAASTPDQFGEIGSIDIFEARCDCGQTILVSGVNWRQGKPCSCGICGLGGQSVTDAASVHGARSEGFAA